MEQLIDQLKIHIAESLKLDPDAVNALAPTDALFGDGLGLDSIDALELVVMLERHYDIRITSVEEGRLAFASLESLAKFVTENRA
jgi:acyl carrier protein